jgi:DNA-binding NarL/FixJ family response regulator
MTALLIVEDDALHRGFLHEVIVLSEVECDELIEAVDGDSAVRIAREHQIKGIVMDLQMPNMTGVQAARTIWAEQPQMPILFWSNYADEAYVRGITKIVPSTATYGYLLKTSSRERLRRSMQCVFVEGQNIVDREVRGMQVRGNAQTERLSESEYEVLLDIAIGLTDAAISARRNISIRSVQGRLQQLYAKLGVLDAENAERQNPIYNSRTRTLAIALRLRLINAKSIQMAEEDYVKWSGGPG